MNDDLRQAIRQIVQAMAVIQCHANLHGPSLESRNLDYAADQYCQAMDAYRFKVAETGTE